MSEPSPPSPGWYPDPAGTRAVRYWDGDRWTEQERPVPSLNDLQAAVEAGVPLPTGSTLTFRLVKFSYRRPLSYGIDTALLTAALMRVGRKYGDFAYRIVNLDAGVAVAQLMAVAEDRGLCAEVLGVDDAALLQTLGLDGDREPITAAIALTAGSGS